MLYEKSTILLVDNNPSSELLLQEVMNGSSIAQPIQSVRNGEEAIHYLEGKGRFHDREVYPFPRVLILDLKMPKISGFELLKWVRSHANWRRLPVIIFTCSQDRRDMTKAYDLGANSYLLKPSKWDDLVATLRTIQTYWTLFSEKPECQAA